jgi:hypothetical protein
VVNVVRIRTAVGWTVGWFVVAGAASLPLATAAQPSSGNSCQFLPDPAWWAWTFRSTAWVSLAVSLPLACAVTAVLAWRTGLSARTCIAIGVGAGFAIALTSVVQSMASATCETKIQLG